MDNTMKVLIISLYIYIIQRGGFGRRRGRGGKKSLTTGDLDADLENYWKGGEDICRNISIMT